ncbi:MAG: secondary thiamine-phosphate synthase enzyme YjbQ [Desulfurococcales archaeon]|nr:secondary thiamine-phosphate synthase enzyme YjbQ [Desulfurococcales archaeon]
MRVYREEVRVSTSRRFELVDITRKVEEVVERSKVKEGFVQVFVPHATAAIIANEHEPRLLQDIIEAIKTLAPPDKPWKHNEIDNNAHAHIAASIIGPSRSFPIAGGQVIRGTWQNIMLVELDGPRVRRVIVTVAGE